MSKPWHSHNACSRLAQDTGGMDDDALTAMAMMVEMKCQMENSPNDPECQAAIAAYKKCRKTQQAMRKADRRAGKSPPRYNS
ncbi:uncharacterized protein AMSG_07735 [Thecamonas trahens ATCC 50062]|uniref:CHCH domain-containing protein n=1 Tax=Thecamonas trahens ATCC 50062 TaxID=461836 RepID=A0A0L0DH82_THETB|nr:hypothetical protein AMSG_07735 [Thecamonas trahens ATCC 50062]KNC51672.1 hypothetical protein AMSG_07735 [Thecamonas trahens ATCC 50062]|eukprot:XP_013755807.1 hypothetical protein AMSG_07735 [Thecamonas trahens ATCC 50062]